MMKPKKNYKPGPMDNCQTPPYAIEPLMDWLDPRSSIWECAAGEGILARALSAKGFQVVCSDIEPHPLQYQFPLDFLEDDMPYYYDAIVTNPPYSLKFDWLERCVELGKSFALLLPVEALGAKRTQRVMSTEGLAAILMHPRVDYKMPDAGWLGSGSQFPSMWLLGSYKNGFLPADECARMYVHELSKTKKQELHDLDKAGKL